MEIIRYQIAKTAKWVDVNELKNMKHANSISVADELIEKVINKNPI